MAKRISVKRKKAARDIATAYKNGVLNRPHKVADARSKRALKKKAYTMA